MSTLVEELKRWSVRSLELEDVAPEDIEPEAPLFGDGLGLDSVDTPEFGVVLQGSHDITPAADGGGPQEPMAAASIGDAVAAPDGMSDGVEDPLAAANSIRANIDNSAQAVAEGDDGGPRQ